jgi:chitosanase
VGNWGISDIQIATIDAIVTIFESGQPANYGAIARDPNDAGGLSYGKHQASLTRGKLFELITAYCAKSDAQCAIEFQPYLPQMKAGDRALDNNKTLIALLKKAADDPAMQQAQDDYFNDNYMKPALTEWQRLGFRTALAAGVVYDSFINSGSLNMMSSTVAKYGQPTAENEREWIAGYVSVRKAWLTARYPANAIRMTTFEGILRDGNWDMKLPIRVMRGANVYYPLTAYDLGVHLFASTVRRLGREGFGVARMGDTTLANGRDRFVQASLNALRYPVGTVDGFFGRGTAAQVKAFQKACGLPTTGEVDGRCFDRLCAELEQTGTTGAKDDVPTDHGLVELPPEKRASTTASKTGAGVAAGAAGVAGVAGAAAGGSDGGTEAAGTVAGTQTGTQTETMAGTQAVTMAGTTEAAAPPPANDAGIVAGPGQGPGPAPVGQMDQPAGGQPQAIPVSASGSGAAGGAGAGNAQTLATVATTEGQIHLPFGITVPQSALALASAGLFVAAVVLFAHSRRRSY